VGPDHANYPHHAARLAAILGLVDPDRAAVADAIRARSAADLEMAAAQVGAVLVRVRAEEEWRASDVAEGDDGVFRIARRVKPDRVISTVDSQARHGHKSRNRSFDGYKAHLSVDPDDELIDEVTVTPANTPDRDAVGDLLGEHTTVAPTGAIDTDTAGSAEGTHVGADDDDVAVTTAADAVSEDGTGRDTNDDEPHEGGEDGLSVFGDSASADADTGRAGRTRPHPLRQGPAHPQPRRTVQQGPVRHRPGQARSDTPTPAG
jgi:hypothetical protein